MSANYQSLRREITDQTRQVVRKVFARRGPDGALRQVHRELAQQLERLPREDRSPVACEAGCDFCCHLRVMATPVEVFAVLDYAEQTLDAKAHEAFLARLGSAEDKLRALPEDSILLTNIACPLLVDGCCSIYPARPLNCRSYHSVSRQACEVSFNNPHDLSLGHPQYTAVAKVNEGLQSGFIRGFADQGLDKRQYELVTALAEAVADPQCRERYQRGEQAFLKALHDF